jgi:site-specific recombinase XerD
MQNNSTKRDISLQQALSGADEGQSIDTEDLLQILAKEALGESESLSSTPISEGIERYLEAHETELANSTLQNERGKLSYFVEFCNCNDIDDWNTVTGREIEEYRVWRRDESSELVDHLSRTTMRDEMLLIRKLTRYLESINAVPEGTSGLVRVPTLPKNEDVRDIELESDRLDAILSHLKKYEYATIEHVTWLLLSKTGRRPSCVRSLDCDDLHLDQEEPYIAFRHRPDETELKNGQESETNLNIQSEETVRILQDYLETKRPTTTDKYGRQPFLASSQGRLALSSIRRYVYKWTRPCMVAGECPHGRSKESCVALETANDASKCPSSKPPYALRHGHFTQMLREGISASLLGDRGDVSEEILLKHYDESSQEDKRKIRRGVLEKLDTEGGAYV